MLRAVGGATKNLMQNANFAAATSSKVKLARSFAHHRVETAEEFDQRFVDFFSQPDIDGWLIRKGMTELQNHDNVPEPKIISAALRACRRVNDYALAVRFLEAVKFKCGTSVKEIYPWLVQEIKPDLDELGISTPEEMGYDKPEFHQPSPDWWPKEYYQLYNIRERKIEEVIGPPYYKYMFSH